MVVYGGGIMRRVGRRLRLAIDADYYRRLSPLIAREYDGLRVAGSVLQQF
jgi:hypothetical protein